MFYLWGLQLFVEISQAKCFESNALLIANTQTKSFELNLQPTQKLNSLCSGIDGDMATVTLIFVDIARSERLLFESQKSNVNLSSKETNTFVIPIVGKDIVALTEYRVSYNIKYGRYGDLQKTAAIFQVKIRALNATNCWSDVQLVYDEADASRQFNVSVTPNECSIESQVVVELQFNFPVTGWRGFEINPTVTADPTFRGFVSNQAYDHSTVHFFNQSFDSLSGESQTQYSAILSEFQKTRKWEFRLVLRFKLDDLDHFVIGQVTSLKTNQDEIFTLATPRAFMDQKRFYIVNNFSSIADSFSELVDVSLVSFVRCDVKLPSFPTLFLQTYTFLSFQQLFAIIIEDDYTPFNDKTFSEKYELYVSLYTFKNESILSLQYSSYFDCSCFEDVWMQLYRTDICIQQYFVGNKACYSRYQNDLLQDYTLVVQIQNKVQSTEVFYVRTQKQQLQTVDYKNPMIWCWNTNDLQFAQGNSFAKNISKFYNAVRDGAISISYISSNIHIRLIDGFLQSNTFNSTLIVLLTFAVVTLICIILVILLIFNQLVTRVE